MAGAPGNLPNVKHKHQAGWNTNFHMSFIGTKTRNAKQGFRKSKHGLVFVCVRYVNLGDCMHVDPPREKNKNKYPRDVHQTTKDPLLSSPPGNAHEVLRPLHLRVRGGLMQRLQADWHISHSHWMHHHIPVATSDGKRKPCPFVLTAQWTKPTLDELDWMNLHEYWDEPTGAGVCLFAINLEHSSKVQTDSWQHP